MLGWGKIGEYFHTPGRIKLKWKVKTLKWIFEWILQKIVCKQHPISKFVKYAERMHIKEFQLHSLHSNFIHFSSSWLWKKNSLGLIKKIVSAKIFSGTLIFFYPLRCVLGKIWIQLFLLQIFLKSSQDERFKDTDVLKKSNNLTLTMSARVSFENNIWEVSNLYSLTT